MNLVKFTLVISAILFTASTVSAQVTAEFFASPLNAKGYLWDVDGNSANDVWAVGDERVYYSQFSYDRHSLIIRWDGTQWVRVPSPTPGVYAGGGTTVTLYDVVSVSADDAWAVGTYETQHPIDNFLGFQTIAMQWDGNSWEVVPTPVTPAGMTGASLHSVVAIASDNVYAAGQITDPVPGDSVEWIGHAVHWDGSQWSQLPIPPTPGFRNEFRDMAAIDATSLIVVGGHSGNTTGARDQPYVLIWDGDWELIDVPVPGGQNFLESVAVIAPDDIWIVGTNFPINAGYKPLFIHFDGTQWSIVEATNFNHYGGSLRGVTAVSSDRLYASGSFAPNQGDFNRPLLMEYDGSAWQQVPTDPNGPVGGTLFAIDATADNEAWAVGIRSGDLNHIQRLQWENLILGDINLDGAVNLLDVSPFIELLSSGTYQAEGDINGDGAVNLLDVDGFINLLGG